METKQHLNWEEILEQFNASGLSIRKFAESHGISHHSLYGRIRRQREQKKPVIKKAPGFVQVPAKREWLKDFRPEITMTLEENSLAIKIRFES